MKFEIPEPMKIEHKELHAELVDATKADGKTGEAARAVAKVLHPHFLKEEEYALPPLGILVRLSKGEFDKDMSEVLAMTDKVEAELPRMLSEHQQIVAALQELIAAAEAEGKPEVADFARKLTLHAQNEEQVAYPTSLLIGRYVKLRLEAVRNSKTRSAA
jgi:hemerythrin superfamily protein